MTGTRSYTSDHVEIYIKYKILKYKRERKESGSGERPEAYIRLHLFYIDFIMMIT